MQILYYCCTFRTSRSTKLLYCCTRQILSYCCAFRTRRDGGLTDYCTVVPGKYCTIVAPSVRRSTKLLYRCTREILYYCCAFRTRRDSRITDYCTVVPGKYCTIVVPPVWVGLPNYCIVVPPERGGIVGILDYCTVVLGKYCIIVPSVRAPCFFFWSLAPLIASSIAPVQRSWELFDGQQLIPPAPYARYGVWWRTPFLGGLTGTSGLDNDLGCGHGAGDFTCYYTVDTIMCTSELIFAPLVRLGTW
jgi:hypothetical protein